MANDKFNVVGTNIAEKATLVINNGYHEAKIPT